MKQTILVVVISVLASAGLARASLDGEELKGDPIEPDATMIIDLPEDEAAREGARAGLNAAPPHTMTVPNVATGQRIALPRAADGSCRTDAITGVTGTPQDRAEFDPDGRHFYQHDIQVRLTTTIDDVACELGVEEAIARDHVRKRVMKKANPRLL